MGIFSKSRHALGPISLGKIKSFGPFGPKYEVGHTLRPLEDGDWMIEVTMIETGEKAEYRWTHLSAYEAWNKALVLEEREAYSNLIRAFTTWQPCILNYFDHPVTNTYTESLYSLIRVMHRLRTIRATEELRSQHIKTGMHDRERRALTMFQRAFTKTKNEEKLMLHRLMQQNHKLSNTDHIQIITCI